MGIPFSVLVYRHWHLVSALPAGNSSNRLGCRSAVTLLCIICKHCSWFLVLHCLCNSLGLSSSQQHVQEACNTWLYTMVIICQCLESSCRFLY